MRNNYLVTFLVVTLLTTTCSASSDDSSDGDVIWRLSNYYGWDQPFAKEVELNSTIESDHL